MNKAWITGLTLAGVAGSAGAAYAGISSADHQPTAVEAQGFPAPTDSVEAPARSFTYQVGPAGTVAVTAAHGSIAIDSALPGAGWTLVGYSAPGTHVEALFTDTVQEVTFIADLVDGEVVVSLTNVPAPGSTVAPASIEITNITGTSPTTAPAPQPAVPAQAPTFVPAPAPKASHTTAPSAGDDDHDDDSYYDGHEDDSHEESHSDDQEEHGDD